MIQAQKTKQMIQDFDKNGTEYRCVGYFDSGETTWLRRSFFNNDKNYEEIQRIVYETNPTRKNVVNSF